MASFPSMNTIQGYAGLVFYSEVNAHEKRYAEQAGDAILVPITALVAAGKKLIASDLSELQNRSSEACQAVKNFFVKDTALAALAIYAYSMCFHFNATCTLTSHSFHVLSHIPGTIMAAPFRFVEFALLGFALRTYGRLSNPALTSSIPN